MGAGRLLALAAVFGGIVGMIWSGVGPFRFQSAEEIARIEQSVTYSGCDEVRAIGKAPIYRGTPGYRQNMDGDGDGVACEPIQ